MTLQILMQLDDAPNDKKHLTTAACTKQSACYRVKASDRSSEKGACREAVGVPLEKGPGVWSSNAGHGASCWWLQL